jgi:iron complex transport system ATP-binding protein
VNGLQIRNLHVRVKGRTLLAGVDLTLGRGDFIALVGPNGAGKTTLIRAALGLAEAAEGYVRLDQRDVGSYRPRDRAARVAWLPQVRRAVEPYPAVELVAAARYRFRESHARSAQAAAEALARVGAATLATRPITELSGGEQQRVALAALLAQQTPLLLLDEPANHLDPAQQREVYGLIGRLWQQGSGVLCVTHDINLLASLRPATPPRVVGLAAGRLRFDLPFDAPELASALSQLFGVAIRWLEDNGCRALVACAAAKPERAEPEPKP